jgi:predicted Zn-dependent peptidase
LLGVGVLVAGGRGDDLVAPDPDAALRKQATQQLTRALSEGRVLARPVLVGAVSNERVEAKLGLAITLRALRSKRADLDALIALAPGAASDPPTHHGRAALLATLLATACGGRTRAELRAELSALGADLEPYVTSRHFGLRLRAPKPHARAALALLAECIARPLLGGREIAYAQRIARESLTRNGSALEWRALVAQALVPRTPGALSPLGSLEGLAANDHRSLRELLAASLEHPDVLVSITGPLPAEVAAMQVARRLRSCLRNARASQASSLRSTTAIPMGTLRSSRSAYAARRRSFRRLPNAQAR